MLGKNTATLLTKPYVLWVKHKHYNQPLSINQLLSPQLKIHRRDFLCTITDIFRGIIILMVKRNNFVMSDIVNSHIPLGALWWFPEVFVPKCSVWITRILFFASSVQEPWANAWNQIIKQSQGSQKTWNSCTIVWEINAKWKVNQWLPLDIEDQHLKG